MLPMLRTQADDERQIAAFRQQIAQLAVDQKLDAGIIAGAVADLIGRLAATLDHRERRRALSERIHPLVMRIEREYGRAMDRLATEALRRPGG
jgi:hypothetical protein